MFFVTRIPHANIIFSMLESLTFLPTARLASLLVTLLMVLIKLTTHVYCRWPMKGSSYPLSAGEKTLAWWWPQLPSCHHPRWIPSPHSCCSAWLLTAAGWSPPRPWCCSPSHPWAGWMVRRGPLVTYNKVRSAASHARMSFEHTRKSLLKMKMV